MTTHILHPKLESDCFRLGNFIGSDLLLLNNSLFPWLILVPWTSEKELHHLPPEEQGKILERINLLSRFLEETYTADKINIAAIGNIVPQLHIHIIARHQKDAAWPGVVWGFPKSKTYTPEEISIIKEKLRNYAVPENGFIDSHEISISL